jgi:O-acetyl-ADP-ribose deacetylase (regulator of RNase III)
MEVHVAQADITNMPVDAVVNPLSSRGEMTSGVADKIRQFGGEEIETVVSSKAPLAIGAALVTEAGDLPAKWIIHVANRPEANDKLEVENVRRAARAALLAADAQKYPVLAIPGMVAITDGHYDPLIEEVARAIVEEIRSHRRPFPETIYLVDEDPDMVEAFEIALENAQQLG